MVSNYDCNAAKFGKNENKFDEFVKKCAPSTWRAFFELPGVTAAVQTISFYLKSKTIEPRMPWTFRALKMVPPGAIKVVILGQDPAAQPGEATGLAFSVRDPKKVPAVLHVLQEVALEGWSVDETNGDLTQWATQGVLLLNSALTVKQDKARSHVALWRPFTKMLIEYISNNTQPSVWLLWGNDAQSFENSIDAKHYVITGGHPSPMSAISSKDPFFGGNYFYCANQFLKKRRGGEINWGLAVVNNVKLPVGISLNVCPPEPASSSPKPLGVTKKIKKVKPKSKGKTKPGSLY